MTSAKALQPPSTYLMYCPLFMKSIMFISKFPENIDGEFKITLLSLLINFKSSIIKTPTQEFSCEFPSF